jgi:hypothetical protein
VNELAKIDGSRHVPVLFPSTAADVKIGRNVAFGHRSRPLMRSSNERSGIIERRREVEFRRNIRQWESAAGDIVDRGSACPISRTHHVCVLYVVLLLLLVVVVVVVVVFSDGVLAVLCR